MNTIIRSAKCFLLLVLIGTNGLSQDLGVSKVGITAAPFLEIGVGARASGMGSAFVATANDASALYWNPAGIARVPKMQVLLMHSDWLAGIGFDFAGVSVPLSNFGTIGAAITYLGSGDMTVRTEDHPEGTGEIFSTSDMAVSLSYARNLTDRFAIGFNIKYINQRIWHSTAEGFALDVGTLFVTGFYGLRIGATLSNFGTEMRMEGKDLLVFHDISPQKLGNNDRVPANLKTEYWSLPLTFQVGLAMEVMNGTWNRVTVGVDALHPSDNTESLNLGLEYSFHDNVFLRTGYQDLFLRDGEQGLTFGGGVITRLTSLKIQLDYAWVDFGHLKNAQRFALGLVF